MTERNSRLQTGFELPRFDQVYDLLEVVAKQWIQRRFVRHWSEIRSVIREAHAVCQKSCGVVNYQIVKIVTSASINSIPRLGADDYPFLNR